MRLQWTSKAVSDLARLYDFLALTNQAAAAKTVQGVVNASLMLIQNPRLGEQLFQFEPREVRRLRTGQYEIRYEIQQSTVYVLRLWHNREER